jgi:hypothetical protein
MRRCWVDVDRQDPSAPHLATPTIVFPGETSLTIDLEFETKQIFTPDGLHGMFQFSDTSINLGDGFYVYIFTIIGNPNLVLAAHLNGVVKTYWLGVPYMQSFTHYWMRITFRVVSVAPPQTEIYLWANGFPWIFPQTANEIFQPFSDRAIMFARQGHGEVTARYSANINWYQARLAFAHLGDYAALRTDGYAFEEHAADVFRFNFIEGSGTQVRDDTLNENTGTIEDYSLTTWRWGCESIPHGRPRNKVSG